MKIINKIKELYSKVKKDYIVVFFIILISIIGISLNIKITVCDELWNFQNIYKLYNGFEIYKDANIICTPLFFYIANSIFNILGANFLVFRIYNIIINTILFLCVYILCKKMNMSKTSSLITMFILIFMGNYTIVRNMANYNILALTFFVIALIVALKGKLEKKDFVIQGILAFLIFFIKQNIGIYYFLAFMFIIIIQNTNLKEKIQNISIMVITTSVLVTIMLLYLYIKGNLEGFINYTILGLSEFASENISINISLILICLSIVSLNIYIAIKLINKKWIGNEQNVKTFIILSTSLTILIFPIINKAHFYAGMFLSFIFTIYIIDLILNNIFEKNKYFIMIQKMTLVFLIVIAIIVSVTNFTNWYIYLKDSNIPSYSPFYGGIIQDGQYDKIIRVTDYIKENNRNVVVLSADAALYMVPLNKNNGNMDLPFKGNLGKLGEEGLIEELKELEDTEILIKKEQDDTNWQESDEVRKYIITNFEYKGILEDYLIYYSK